MKPPTNEARDNAVSPRVWLVRAGARGEDESLALELGLAVIGFNDIPDLTNVDDRGSMLERVRQANPGVNDNRNRNRANQLSAFVLRMQEGDIVALPLKTRPGQIALGRITGPYRYRDIDGVMRHTRQVTWLRPDVPRSEFGQDLLYSLGAFLTICRIERNGAERRVAALLNGTSDPGDDTSDPEISEGEEAEEDGRASLDIAQTARDQIIQHIRSRFPGHDFARLVDAVLQAEGYATLLSSPGPDGGVDILAGRGQLGFGEPRLCVQVKATESPVDVTVLRSLMGTMQSFKADQGLLMSWGGFTHALKREARQAFFTVRLWQADDIVDAICKNYDRLPEQIQNEIPLERVWTIVRTEGEL